MTRRLEYLDEALDEAEEAARWYAERSPTAAEGFTSELDVAATAIEQAPEAWPPYDHGTRRFLLRRFPYFAAGSGTTFGWLAPFSSPSASPAVFVGDGG